MEREVVFNFVKNKLQEQGAVVDSIDDATPLKLRPLTRIKLFICCEKQYGIEMTIEDDEKIKTVGDIVDFFYKRTKQKK